MLCVSELLNIKGPAMPTATAFKMPGCDSSALLASPSSMMMIMLEAML